MKIVIINGSPRTKGLTAAILHSIESFLTQKNVNVMYYDLCTLNISPCIGCCNCYKTGFCHINDDAQKLSEIIQCSDGLILGSPTYASNVSGYMKLFIDRGHFVVEQLLKDKYCTIVATGENYGSSDTKRILKKLILYSGGYLTQSMILNAPFNSASSISEDISKISEKSAAILFDAISAHRKKPLQSVYHQLIFYLGLKPFVIKKGLKYQGVIDRWKDLGLII
ncbi:MAG: flavodoxin family protein [Lachnospiraceae bacterium]|nr:flavodoxin family protein [Lachnospiraceae bacterium]